ncbi:MAG: hypothetical protein GY755_22375 [Chloroflexi bacterium]|nr:hypothetical protein [Chloroflexota bacterium]
MMGIGKMVRVIIHNGYIRNSLPRNVHSEFQYFFKNLIFHHESTDPNNRYKVGKNYAIGLAHFLLQEKYVKMQNSKKNSLFCVVSDVFKACMVPLSNIVLDLDDSNEFEDKFGNWLIYNGCKIIENVSKIITNVSQLTNVIFSAIIEQHYNMTETNLKQIDSTLKNTKLFVLMCVQYSQNYANVCRFNINGMLKYPNNEIYL